VLIFGFFGFDVEKRKNNIVFLCFTDQKQTKQRKTVKKHRKKQKNY